MNSSEQKKPNPNIWFAFGLILVRSRSKLSKPSSVLPITQSLLIQEYQRVPIEVSCKGGCESTHLLLLCDSHSQTNN